MRILLMGASGFIGAQVATELRREGAEVVAFEGDVRDREAIERAAHDCEVVVHAAALYTYEYSDAMDAANVGAPATWSRPPSVRGFGGCF